MDLVIKMIMAGQSFALALSLYHCPDDHGKVIPVMEDNQGADPRSPAFEDCPDRIFSACHDGWFIMTRCGIAVVKRNRSPVIVPRVRGSRNQENHDRSILRPGAVSVPLPG